MKMYKPNRVTMSPQNEAIDPTIDNSFQFIFNGEVLSEYNINFFDLFTGSPITSQNVILGAEKFNGETISYTVPAAFWTTWSLTNSQMSYSLQCLGREYTMSVTISNPVVTIPNANYDFAEYVFIDNAVVFGGLQDFYLAPTGTPGDYYVYLSIEAARNGLVSDRQIPAASGTAGTKAMVFSEQVPFRTAEMPTLTLALITATTGVEVVTPTYTHPDGYALNRYTVYLYDSAETLIMQTNEIFSSNPTYTFENLADGESYKVQFTGWSVLEQFVDTGKIVMNVTYPVPIPEKTYAVSAVNDCVNGRINVTIAASPVQMQLGTGVPYDEFDVTGILLYREEETEAVPEIIAVLPAGTISYHDYMAQSGKSYRYWIGFYGYITVSYQWNGTLVVGNTPVTSFIPASYFGWFLVDLDGDKSYAFDVLPEGGDISQEDDYTKYKSNVKYNSYSVGSLQAMSSNNVGLISVGNLHLNFSETNDLIRDIRNLISPSNRNRKIVKDNRTITRIYPVFTYGFRQTTLNNGIAAQPYLCSFSWDQVDDAFE